ncbi:helix-turn-helix domain-containing protein [Brachybacterium sp. AOP43-C2-M15]|uniref:helix-turn-helix domain-containing protein n=1 Tax=Brachybacterium sp. AOP43-C2-M15 TaxID=3457661 RepID=UPI004033913B
MDGTVEPLLRELIGSLLRAERRRQGRTLAAVAAQAGMSMQHLSDVERGRKDPSSEMLAAITGALDWRLQELLHEALDPMVDGAAVAARGAERDSALAAPTSDERDRRREHLQVHDHLQMHGHQRARPTAGPLTLLSAA